MDNRRLKELFNSLTIREKIGQTILLNGNLFSKVEKTMETGPAKDLGFMQSFNPYHIGALFNVNDHQEIYNIQSRFLENSRHKIPLLFMSDVIYGFRTIFPIPLAQSGSFDFELIEECAAISARESYQNGLHVLFSPMLDLVRDPRWGRVMESPGEDVYLVSKYAKHVVQGYQGQINEKNEITDGHVAACIKHFASYGAPEGGREYNTVDMSELKFRQLYLPGYQSAFKANARLVMTALNLLNGIPCTGNLWLNRQILREENGFDGVLVSDYAAIEELIAHGYAKDNRDAVKKAMEAGVDFDMMTSTYSNELEELILSGELDQSLLDEAVWRILELKNQLGLFENPFRGLNLPETGKFLSKKAKEKATELVEKSMVLLKNQNNILPLNKEQKIALIGPYGTSTFTLGFWASVSGSPLDTVSLMDGLKEHAGEGKLEYAKGYNLFDSYEIFGPLKESVERINGPIEDPKKLFIEAHEKAQDADVIIVTFGEHFLESGEGASKTKLRISEEQKRLIESLYQINKPMIGILYTGRPLVLTNIEPYFEALLLVWYPGTMGGVGISNLLMGKANPSGKLSMTFPRTEGQIPIYYAQYSTGRPMVTSNHSPRFISKYIDEENEPLFPFGHGLSYSEFHFGLIGEKYRRHHLTMGETIKLEYWVENISDRDGEAVLQLYCHDRAASIVRPLRELKDSRRVYLPAKEKKIISFELTPEHFSFVDVTGTSIIEEGVFDWYLGTSSQETPVMVTIELIERMKENE